MKRVGFVLLCTGLLMGSCNDDDTKEIISPITESTTLPLNWSIMPIEDMRGHTRALINSNTNLENACKPTTGEGIGIWGDYELNTNEGKQTIEGFLDDVKLIYYGISQAEDSPTGWDYSSETEDQYWVWGGVYKFRAYYPQTAIRDHVISSSNATTFVINYNTTQLQEDLLVAYQPINTMQWNLAEPVPLQFRHALAGLRFQFQLEQGLNETDYLTSCWLQNTSARDFTSVGMLAYGTEDPNNNNEYNPNWLDWHESYNSPATEKMYYWECPRTGSTGGIEIKMQGSANPATAYTNATGTTEGTAFLNNDGYVLIIPQQSDGTVQLCFTTYEGGKTVYRIPIPQVTGTSTDTQRGNFSYDKNNTLILGSAIDTSGTDFVAGYLYTYMVTITKTNLGMTLSIAPWNELKSSFDISF